MFAPVVQSEPQNASKHSQRQQRQQPGMPFTSYENRGKLQSTLSRLETILQKVSSPQTKPNCINELQQRASVPTQQKSLEIVTPGAALRTDVSDSSALGLDCQREARAPLGTTSVPWLNHLPRLTHGSNGLWASCVHSGYNTHSTCTSEHQRPGHRIPLRTVERFHNLKKKKSRVLFKSAASPRTKSIVLDTVSKTNFDDQKKVKNLKRKMTLKPQHRGEQTLPFPFRDRAAPKFPGPVLSFLPQEPASSLPPCLPGDSPGGPSSKEPAGPGRTSVSARHTAPPAH